MREHNPGISPREKRRHLPPGRRLSPHEIFLRTVSPEHGRPIVTHEYIRENVIGVDLGGVTVLLAEIDHEKLDPQAVNLLASPKTKFAIAEYFGPDLANHGLTSTDTLAGSIAESNPRIKFANMLADTLHDLRKDVSVVDIANRPLFEGYYNFQRGYLTMYSLLSTVAFGTVSLPIQAGLFAALAANNITASIQEETGTGMFNKDKITKSEKFMFDLEEVRRIIAAKGIEQLAHEMRESGMEDGIIVALYPKAHRLRVADMLEHPGRLSNTIKGAIAKALTPGLEYRERRYHPQPVEDTEEGEKINWRMLSRRKIRTTTVESATPQLPRQEPLVPVLQGQE